ncbi:Transposase [Mariprofundus ferrinatatus]|uniref:Transposase n=1 Tax=Mariprofundus ferrinatatus TaxID=1921087 RepID=A0A2K8LBT4_9PROT|nr:IS1182 family transposase [Mariprofundus ferrinatatus]ATX81706.1 Transposase [Mariprofundus ferrinatatus]
MKRFIEGQSRTQGTLLPEIIDEYVEESNPVRIVDVFVDELDLEQLGFTGVNPADTGRPAYHPAVLLKLYIYGYLNRIQSSRRLEREAQRNVELMWLLGRLTPDFKTIANFRKDNGKGIRGVCRQFVVLCRELGLFADSLAAIDGSKFKAVNNRDRNFTSAKLKRRMQEIEASIERYLTAMDSADRQEPGVAKVRNERLQDKVSALKKRMKELKSVEEQIKDSPDHQISLTDPDSRSMKTRGQGIVGYNVQTAVDTKHHLIVTHEVFNTGTDRDQLSNMAVRARDAMGVEQLEVVADRGYYKSEEILACEETGITPLVPKAVTSRANREGRFDRADFIYDEEKNEYACPAGDRLIWRFARVESGKLLNRYWSSNCQQCQLKGQCTPGEQRRISRWEHEEVLEAMQVRVDQSPDCMRIRRETVEHPFGTLKSWMGHSHFLTRGLDRVRTEMSLHVLAYNMKRMINIMGVQGLMAAIKA